MRNAPNPVVSVVIPNWNQRSLLDACLHSLSQQEFQDFETIMVDNGSSDGSVDHVASNFPSVQILALDSNLGFATASNRGIRMARGKYIALLNNDTEVDRLWLQELVGALDSNLEVGFCASKILLLQDPSIADACGDFYTVEGVAGKFGHLEQADRHKEPRLVFGASAGAAIYRGSMLEDIGLFDEEFFMVHEDSDLSFRAQLMGFKCLYVPTAMVYHHLGATLGRDSDTAAYYAQRNMEFVYLKNMPFAILRKYWPAHLLTNVMLFATYALRAQVKPYSRAKTHALVRMPAILEKRGEIQKSRRVSDKEIENLLMKGWLGNKVREKFHQALR